VQGVRVLKNSIHFLKLRQDHFPNLIFALALGTVPGLDLEILSHDTKFMQSLEETKNKFQNRYTKLLAASTRQ
jgi:hypothetical protein